ncbi:ribonuclease Z [Candidatus Micrarchaeota archaeon]|nr:ribonuclease Z [Candidatus Micrarchaeota archaeon]
MKLTVLGTSASTPSKERNLSSILLNFDGLNYLFDCPEGTQRQLMKAKASYMKIHAIFLSHFHGDHILGLPGLLATMSMHQRDYPLLVFGPKGIKEKVNKALELSLLKVTFEIKSIELKQGKILEEENFFVECFKLNHDVPCYGFVFREKDSLGKFSRETALKLGIPEGPLWGQLQKGKKVKVEKKVFNPKDVLDESKKKTGKKISFVFDTLANNSYVEKVKESDVLFHESTFLEKLTERAKETKHSTAKQAAKIASKAKVKKLVLFHFSPRHKETEKFDIEAREFFGNVTAAKDLEEIEL